MMGARGKARVVTKEMADTVEVAGAKGMVGMAETMGVREILSPKGITIIHRTLVS